MDRCFIAMDLRVYVYDYVNECRAPLRKLQRDVARYLVYRLFRRIAVYVSAHSTFQLARHRSFLRCELPGLGGLSRCGISIVTAATMK